MGKRFTPKLLARFEREHRSEGAYEDFVPYHKVARGDPSSLGRSHLLMFRKRLREMLSDGELDHQYFAVMLPWLDDCLEQYKLTPESSPHPLAAYNERDARIEYPGTLELANVLQIKHPHVYGDGEKAVWKMTTDLVLVQKQGTRPREMVALASKPEGWEQHGRTVEKLLLEREYWKRRGVPWLLITSALYDKRVSSTLRRTACWGLTEPASPRDRTIAVGVGRQLNGQSLECVLQAITHEFDDLARAQFAFWQAVWSGELTVDLRRGWRPHLPVRLLDPQSFWALNPVASRRSAWPSN